MTPDKRAEWIWVTKEVAERWLTERSPNRRLDEGRAVQYGIEMEQGRWQETHQGIAFDTRGRLVDGQHRLHAISLQNNGYRVRMLVTRGLTDAEVMAIDHGRQRDVADSLTIFHGKPISKYQVAVTKRVMHISPYYARLANRTPGSSWLLSAAEVDKFMRDHEAALLRAQAMRNRTRTMGLTNALVGSLIVRAHYHLPAARCDQLIDVLSTGHYDDVDRDSGALILRERLVGRAEGFRGHNLMDHYRMERAIKAFWKGEKMVKINPVAAEIFPLPEEKDEEPVLPAVIRRLEKARALKSKLAGVAAQTNRRAAEA